MPLCPSSCLYIQFPQSLPFQSRPPSSSLSRIWGLSSKNMMKSLIFSSLQQLLFMVWYSTVRGSQRRTKTEHLWALHDWFCHDLWQWAVCSFNLYPFCFFSTHIASFMEYMVRINSLLLLTQVYDRGTTDPIGLDTNHCFFHDPNQAVSYTEKQPNYNHRKVLVYVFYYCNIS